MRMSRTRLRGALSNLLAEHGMVLILLLLCGYFSIVTIAEQSPTGAAGGTEFARDVLRRTTANDRVLILVGEGDDESAFAAALARALRDAEVEHITTVAGEPRDARRFLQELTGRREQLEAIAASQLAASWPVLEDLDRRFPSLAGTPVLTPTSYRWPNFLKTDNLLNIANQIAIIAILAIGMTLVVITGGIDLSVGSLIALSAVTTTLLIRNHAGADAASPLGMILCCFGGIAVCGGVGLCYGLFVTAFNIPPFIVTLSAMLIARGMAFRLAAGQSIYELPASFVWLGGRADLAGIPNAVVLTLILYVLAHVLMSRTVLGRHIYAVGGNARASRLSGIRVERVLLTVYVLSGVLAGLGGIVLASQLKSGAPTYGQNYELHVIAAVAVGGASLLGGKGTVSGTLIGALIIAVIKNGMNLTGVESYTQDIVFGAVILGAVLFDEVKKRGWAALERRWRQRFPIKMVPPSEA
jgi:ribose transport system permease protein